jgi:hypothetical protein
MIKQREEEGGTQLDRALQREQQLRTELYEERRKRLNLAKRYVNILAGDSN